MTTEPVSSRSTERLIRRALRYWPMILVATIVAGIAGYLFASSRAKVYEATTTVQVSDVDLASIFAGQFLQRPETAQLLASNAKLVNIPRVREAASAALGGDPTPDELADQISTKTETDTTLLVIGATGDSPREAAATADAVRKAFIVTRSDDARGQLDNARKLAEEELARLQRTGGDAQAISQLRSRLDQLATLRAVTGGGVITVQTARPPKDAVAPKPKRTAILAAFTAFLLATGLALLRAYTDRRVQDADELAELWELPVLGLIPEDGSLRRGHEASRTAVEAYSLAMTSLRYANPAAESRTIVITSAGQGEGKTTTVWHLAVAAAATGARVIAVDADLRRPRLSRLAQVSGVGTSDVLAGLATLDQAIQRTTPQWAGGAPTVDVLPAGTVPPNPLALLESDAATALLTELAARYDLVLIDTPPATVVADARAVLERADGVLVVARLDRLDRNAYLRLRTLLEAAPTTVLGVVIGGGASAAAYDYATDGSTS